MIVSGKIKQDLPKKILCQLQTTSRITQRDDVAAAAPSSVLRVVTAQSPVIQYVNTGMEN